MFAFCVAGFLAQLGNLQYPFLKLQRKHLQTPEKNALSATPVLIFFSG